VILERSSIRAVASPPTRCPICFKNISLSTHILQFLPLVGALRVLGRKGRFFLRVFLSGYNRLRGSYGGSHDGREGPQGSPKFKKKACFLYHFDGSKYDLLAKTLVPPRKAHARGPPRDGYSLGDGRDRLPARGASDRGGMSTHRRKYSRSKSESTLVAVPRMITSS
jgi:hypothetical protein